MLSECDLDPAQLKPGPRTRASKGPSTNPIAEQPRFELRATREDRSGWDRFAHSCDATYRCAYRAALTWQIKYHLLFSLRRYDILACDSTGTRKVGQFAIGFGLKLRVFGDILQLLPEYRHAWPTVMRSVLESLGAGQYVYGSDWTTEPSRSEQFLNIPDVVLLHEKDIDLYAVDFSGYASWEAYYKAVSSNAKRNQVASARGGSKIHVYDSTRSLSIYLHLLLLKKKMFLRKNLKLSIRRSLLVFMTRFYSFRSQLFTAKILLENKSLSVFCGLRFGRDLYYMEGASVEKPGGATWCLLIAMLRLAYEESRGLGKCMLGPDDGSERDQVAWENLRRQRLQCRAKPFATSIVTLSYDPP